MGMNTLPNILFVIYALLCVVNTYFWFKRFAEFRSSDV